MMNTDKDMAVFVTLENGILREIKHRTNDVINDITRRLNESLREIVQTVTDGAKDLEECIRQDILDARPSLDNKNSYKKEFNPNAKVCDSDKVKVGLKELKEWKEKNNKQGTFNTKVNSNDGFVNSSGKMKIGIKELKEWKRKKELLDASSNDEVIHIKDEKIDKNVNKVDIDELYANQQYLTLEDCMKNGITDDQLDRYTKSCNPGDSNRSTVPKEEDSFVDSDADFVDHDTKVSSTLRMRQSRKTRNQEEQLSLDSDSDSLELIPSKQKRGKDKITTQANDNGDSEFSCTLCSFTGRYNSLLRRHMEEVHDKSQKCVECDYATGRRIKLIYHIREKHQARKDFKCKFLSCNFTTSYKKSLKRHVNSVHK